MLLGVKNADLKGSYDNCKTVYQVAFSLAKLCFWKMLTILCLCLSYHSGASQEFRKMGYFSCVHYLHRLVVVFLIFSLELGLTEQLE